MIVYAESRGGRLEANETLSRCYAGLELRLRVAFTELLGSSVASKPRPRPESGRIRTV
jgi:hypothetical protein